MKRLIHYTGLAILLMLPLSCSDTLEPKPVDLLTDDLVLNEPADVANVQIGLYSAFRNIIPSTVIAGDMTADMLVHNGTFSQYRELGNKQITSANQSASVLWRSLYNTIYIANFILERLPEIQGVPAAQRSQVTATAHFLRGYAYFIGAYSYGGIPKVLTTDIATNRTIPRAGKEDILALALEDYNAALGKLTPKPANGFAGDYAVRSALARYYLYAGNWQQAESFASSVIDSKAYALDTAYATIVNRDFPGESIFEVGYTISDDPGTSTDIGLNNLFRGRREIIPSNPEILALASNESGDRFSSITFRAANLNGADNGWSVAKYGTADEDNNNVYVFRLAELYLIRAEARARQGKVIGTTGAQADLNILRDRANAPAVAEVSQSQMISLVEEERRYELAFEGHRWYDLVRTGRVKQVMPTFSANWDTKYELWPIPQREIQNNTALKGNQNPGY